MIRQTWKAYILIISILCISAPLFSQPGFTSSDIPIIVIETNGLKIVDEPGIIAQMGIIDNPGSARNYISDAYNGYNGRIDIEIRGTTSQAYPKKQYGFETQNDDGSNNNVSLLGLPEENDWILYAPYSDKSLIRNVLTYTMYESLGHYAPRTKLCELILNGEYMGVYVLIEKIKRDLNRVDISELGSNAISGDDLTGGYIVKIDKSTADDCPVWYSNQGEIYFQYEYPECDEIVPEQKAYILDYINSFEQALNADYFSDPIIGFRNYIDEKSFIDFLIVNEVSKNVDGYSFSTFFYKDKESVGGKLTMGPVWDYNFAFGNADFRNAFMTEGFQLYLNPRTWWWKRLLQDTLFLNGVKERWCDVRNNQYSDQRIIEMIDSLAMLIHESQDRNFERWDILGRKVWPNYYIGNTYDHEIALLKTWTLNRLLWLDDTLGFEPDPEQLSVTTNVYPNPFNDHFNFSFLLTYGATVSLILYDISGKPVVNIIDQVHYPAGVHLIYWDSQEIQNSMYFLVLKLDGQVLSSRKVIKMQ